MELRIEPLMIGNKQLIMWHGSEVRQAFLSQGHPHKTSVFSHPRDRVYLGELVRHWGNAAAMRAVHLEYVTHNLSRSQRLWAIGNSA